MADTETDPNDLLQQISDNTAKALRYSRLRFLATWLALGLLAILTCAALIAASRGAQTDLQHTEDIAQVADENAAEAQQSTDDVVKYLRGEQGIPGVPGANGVDGTPGQPSSEPGPAGSDGPKGDTGAMGPIGPTGPQGAAGTVTTSGGTGSEGNTGSTGPKGDTGPAGAKGDTGEAGPAGTDGKDGAAGPQGPPGVTPPINSTVAIASSANDPNEPKQVTAQCASGRVTGGGFALAPSDPGIIVTASAPNGNGWNVQAEELSLPAATNWQLLTFAVCVG